MSRFPGHEEFDEEMDSVQSYEEGLSDDHSDPDVEGGDDVHAIRANFLAHLRSSNDPSARQLARVFQAAMPGFELEDAEGEGDDGAGGADNELGPLLARLRSMRRRMFDPVSGPLAGHENDDFEQLLGDDDDDTEVIVGSSAYVSRIRLSRIAHTILEQPSNINAVTVALNNLNSVIILNSPEDLAAIMPVELVKALVGVLQMDLSPMVLVLVTRTISHVLESNQSSLITSFVENGLIEALAELFCNMAYIDVAEHAVTVLDRVVGEYPQAALMSGCVLSCIGVLDFFNTHIQRTIMSITNQACASVEDHMKEAVEDLLPTLKEQAASLDIPMSELALSGLSQIIISASKRFENVSEWFEKNMRGQVIELLLFRTHFNATYLARMMRALSLLASEDKEVTPLLLQRKFAKNVAQSLARMRFAEEVDTQLVLANLLDTPKDKVLAGLKLLQHMFPAPQLVEGEAPSAYRRAPSPRSPDISDVSGEDRIEYAKMACFIVTMIYSTSMDTHVRELALTVVLQVCEHLTADQLDTLAEKVDFSSFLSSVVAQNDAPSVLLLGGFEIVYELAKKRPHRYLPEFSRRGLAGELERVAAAAADPADKHSVALGAATQRVQALYVEFPQYGESNDGHEVTELLAALERGEARFSELVRLINEYSSLELMKFGVFDALLNMLGDPARFPTVIEEITPAVVTLVSKAQDALSHAERLGVLSSSSSSTVQSLAAALTRPINIRLHVNGDQRAWTLRVQGIAAVEAIEDFYRTRVAEPRRPNLFSILADHDMQNGAHDEDEDDEDEDEDDEDEDDNDVFDHEEHSDVDGVSFNDAVDFETVHDLAHHPMASSEDDQSGDDLAEALPSDHESDSTSGTDRSKKPKLYFYLNGRRIYRDMSIVGAVFRSFPAVEGDNVIPRSLWSDVFTVVVSKTPMSSESDDSVLGRGRRVRAENVLPNETPASFGSNQQFSTAIRLLAVLWTINNTESLCPKRKFVNPILTAKLNRQLEDPLVVVSSILPQWTVDIVRLYPFLFPFDTRYLFIQSTSFGYSRCMARWQTNGEGAELRDLGPQGARSSFQSTAQAIARTGVLNHAGRPLKQKFTVSRTVLFSDFQYVFSKLGSSPAILEIEFANEAGTGLGPTQEFYALMSREFALTDYHLWRGTDVDGFLHHSQGLYPAPVDRSSGTPQMVRLVHETMFMNVGRFVSRALLDQRILDFRFNPAFFVAVLQSRGFLTSQPLRLCDVDAELDQSLSLLTPDNVEALELTFVLPGNDNIELCPQGAAKPVTAANLDEYRQAVADVILYSGIETLIAEFVKGFSQSLPIESLQALLPDEFCMLCGQSDEDWSTETLFTSIIADHGYTMASRAVQNLLAVMSSLTPEERRAFLQFATGSPNLPIGGFKALQPPFTVVLKHPENEDLDRDAYLPSVMTCANYLKLPDYSSRAVLMRQLRLAVQEGSDSFQLS